jgi:hypothetical protein
MKKTVLTLAVGIAIGATFSGTSAKAMGISLDGMPIRSLIAAVLMAGTITDRGTAYTVASQLIAGK